MPAEILSSIANLLARAGIQATVEAISPLGAGGNNRIYRIDTTSGVYAAKQYFRHQGDTRDRLSAEYAFLAYAHAAAPGTVPRPLARDTESGIALYEFVDGEPFRAGDISSVEVDAAAAFFCALNSQNARSTVMGLPLASESSFSIAAHLDMIEKRIEQLLAAADGAESDRKSRIFIRTLASVWQELSVAILREVRALGWDPERLLLQDQRCISPSDFGFHNALRSRSGAIHFLDFEYAGWDDPAKTTGDFFAQLAVPVPSEYFERFVSGIMQSFSDSSELIARARLLRPAYQIKWCCIAMNVFLPVHLARRKFANPALDENALKQMQLAKAEKILQTVQALTHGLH